MKKINQGRTVPGMGSNPPLNVNQTQPEEPHLDQGHPASRKQIQCPFGIESCKRCKLGIQMDEKRVECSITLLALEAVKAGIKVGN